MDERLRSVMASALHLSEAEATALSDTDTIHTVNHWDSLGHIRLVIALEQAYEISIRDEQAIKLTSVERIVEMLQRRQVERVS
ncbi:MAG: phosphopantetheine-binding protein [Candidatus Omnitrophota bacterium]|nr:phosphopantetheine-binding protein [Candidatus Omnitrophota bacterium]